MNTKEEQPTFEESMAAVTKLAVFYLLMLSFCSFYLLQLTICHNLDPFSISTIGFAVINAFFLTPLLLGYQYIETKWLRYFYTWLFIIYIMTITILFGALFPFSPGGRAAIEHGSKWPATFTTNVIIISSILCVFYFNQLKERSISPE